MTRETFSQSSLYTIATTGPYPITHPYQIDSEILGTIFQGDTVIELDMDAGDFSVSPSASETTGDVTISAALASTYAGASLLIRRKTVSDQGWAGQNAREKGLEAQLDALTQRVQEMDEAADRALKIPTGVVAELPLDLVSKYPFFDASGELVAVTASAPSTAAVTAFMETLLDDMDAATARATLGIDTAALTYAGNQTLSNNWPMYHFVNTGASADLGTWRVSVTTAGIFSINWASDDLATVIAGFQIERDASGPTEYNFYIGAAVIAATIDAAGETLSGDQSVITREKGDARYFGAKVVSKLNMAITPGVGFTVGSMVNLPDIFKCYLTCLTAEHGYIAGDTITVSPNDGQASGGKGFYIYKRSNFDARYGNAASVFDGSNRSTGAPVTLTNANWDFSVVGYYL